MGEAQEQNSPAGWYPDPNQVDTQRYWDGRTWTDQRAPLAASPKWGVAQAGPALALVGSVAMGAALFLPLVEHGSVPIEANTLIQHIEGKIGALLAIGAAMAAYQSLFGKPRSLMLILIGLVGLVLAVTLGLIAPDRLETVTPFEGGLLGELAQKMAEQDAAPGVGIYAFGLGSVLVAIGGEETRRLVGKQDDR